MNKDELYKSVRDRMNTVIFLDGMTAQDFAKNSNVEYQTINIIKNDLMLQHKARLKTIMQIDAYLQTLGK